MEAKVNSEMSYLETKSETVKENLFLLVSVETRLIAVFHPRGGYSREFLTGVCREGSWTLTLFKDWESENWYPF